MSKVEAKKDNKNTTNKGFNKDLTRVVRKDDEGAEDFNPAQTAQGNNAHEQILYQKPTVTVVEVNVSIKGRDFKFLKVKENDGIVVVPVVVDNDGDYVILERQYRPAIRKYIYELPAGHIEKSEDKIDAVKREMEEETGYTPKKVSYLFKGYPMPGTNTSMHYFYLARDFSKSKAEPEADEDISVEKARLDKAIEMIRSGEIIDLKTIAGLLYYYYIFKNGR